MDTGWLILLGLVVFLVLSWKGNRRNPTEDGTGLWLVVVVAVLAAAIAAGFFMSVY